jgi:hypothetical protein
MTGHRSSTTVMLITCTSTEAATLVRPADRIGLSLTESVGASGGGHLT